MVKNAHNVAAFRRRKAQKGQVRLEAYVHRDDLAMVKQYIEQLRKLREAQNV